MGLGLGLYRPGNRERLRFRPREDGASIPLAPSGASVAQVDVVNNRISWTDNSSNETHFEVQRNAGGAGYAALANTAANATSYDDTTASVGTEYTYRVRAVGSGGESEWVETSAITPGYMYGYPAASTRSAEPNVVAQWLFDESSDNIVDEVNSIELLKIGTGHEYEQTASGIWSSLSPGIKYNIHKEHSNLSDQSVLNIPPYTDFVVELVCRSTVISTGYVAYMFTLNGGGSSTSYGVMCYVTYSASSDTYDFRSLVRSDDAKLVHGTYRKNGSFNDGNLHKMRWAYDRDENLTTYFDGESLGTLNISTLASKTFTNKGIRLPGQYNGNGNSYKGTLYEARITIGNCTNNSGGPGGG